MAGCLLVVLPVNIQFSKISIVSPPARLKPSRWTIHEEQSTCMTCKVSIGRMVGLARLELATSPLSGVRSSHLSYRPIVKSVCGDNLVELVGIEPATS